MVTLRYTVCGQERLFETEKATQLIEYMSDNNYLEYVRHNSKVAASQPEYFKVPYSKYKGLFDIDYSAMDLAVYKRSNECIVNAYALKTNVTSVY